MTMSVPALTIRYTYRLFTLVIFVAVLIFILVHLGSLSSAQQRNFSLKTKLKHLNRNGDVTFAGSFDVGENRTSQSGHLQSLMSQYPWLQKHNFIPNYYTLGNGDRKRYKNPQLSIVFVHNPKAGGRTMKSCLDNIAHLRSYPKPTRIRIRDKEYPYDSLEVQKFYVSEFTFGICDTLDESPCSYFTLLRDPYERLISCFDYCNVPEVYDPICGVGDVKHTTLRDWVVKQGNHFFRQLLYNFKEVCFNSATHDRLIGDTDGHKSPCWYLNKLLLDKILTEEEKDILLHHILSNLERWFAVIGLVEDYDLSLKMLEEAYGLPFYQECGNVHISRPGVNVEDGDEDDEHKKQQQFAFDRKRELMADTAVAEALKRDVLIYEKAKEIFQRQKDRYLAL